MIKDDMHIKICDKYDALQSWFADKSKDISFPFYSSYDIRESNYKVAPVDANIFPAGFNNICAVDQESAVEKVKNYFKNYYPNIKGTVALITEAHTKNAYYWQNVYTICNLLKAIELPVVVAIPSESQQSSITVETISGHQLEVNFIYKEGHHLLVNGEKPCFIISNNDFSVIFDSWKQGVEQPVNPPYELGWYQRKKTNFFNHYNQLATEFSQLIGVNQESLTVFTESFSDFDINSEESRELLAQKVDEALSKLSSKYQALNMSEAPFLFIKNSSGTYGMGIQQELQIP
jgi:glutamate--cysteine ligase